jgi:tRNA dimethylallyltransferase
MAIHSPPVVSILGPTASGKSDLALSVAQATGGEIINADSMQLYRGMDIGTAKLAIEQRGGVPHHLLDVLDIQTEATVAWYQREVSRVIHDVLSRNRIPILVGGSGLYLNAAVNRLTIPPTDADVRAKLEADLDDVGPAALHQRLHDIDPAAAAVILPGNGRRIVRALEVIQLTGKPYLAALPQGEYLRPTLQFGLRIPREILYQRIADRVERMWAAGLVNEFENLRDQGLGQAPTASRALGYAQLLHHGVSPQAQPQARQDTIAATRRYARRQESWFRRDGRIVWLQSSSPDNASVIEAAIKSRQLG